ncbi:urea ABC transporter permease subunit UrtB [Psychromarinibacter sp. C21-152]|uniref:Urea ABC transporter permease subunit UrtB n=1 Tax=Psychromarinibacter sediminicola TaxID=3033385 RepID=A0AAE3NKX8_9RHOB|nr:urea ABC transporter permease subunit UrtB [Psychromarinibacter sediminicola]MDF0599808.1 urea ABC transporter permease subunit UrtB [Psychromarinibacter sediminicola]
MTRILTALAACLLLLAPAPAPAQDDGISEIQALLQAHRELIEDSSRRTIGPAIDALADSGLPAAQAVLERWQAKEMYQRESDGLFFFAEEAGEDDQGEDLLTLYDIATGEELETVLEDGMDQLRPNSGIRGMMGAALVRFQLKDPDPAVRLGALDAIGRDAEPSHLPALRAALEAEDDPDIAARMDRLARLLTIQFSEDDAARIAAIESFAGDLGVDVRATLNPLVRTDLRVTEGPVPDDVDLARVLTPGTEALSKVDAYEELVDADLAPPLIDRDAQKAALVTHLADGEVAGIQVADLNTEATRDMAYAELVRRGAVEAAATQSEIDDILAGFSFYEVYTATSPEVVAAAVSALQAIDRSVAFNEFLDLALDALSLASIYFLAAIGLAITFGVMRVINMAHGEFIMMGAYTGYVVQQIIPDYTASLIVALPAAFAVTFGAGVAMERLVIRWLYHRPLETLLATFGISIALQQLARNIFGTQARPLTSPDWLGGALTINDVVSISYIRIAIFGLALIFLCVFLFIMNRTRVGLEVRAVTQNPAMAASMGINPDRINMLTFGLGSGIAGIAGVAIGLWAKVTSELGQDYIVQSFMTVVVGGVGNIWGTLLGAGLIGALQKFIEWFNPSNTLAAQTYMIIFIIIFIQFRPRGLIALKGRAAEA